MQVMIFASYKRLRTTDPDQSSSGCSGEQEPNERTPLISNGQCNNPVNA